jgi:hypothetical protein
MLWAADVHRSGANELIIFHCMVYRQARRRISCSHTCENKRTEDARRLLNHTGQVVIYRSADFSLSPHVHSSWLGDSPLNLFTMQI